MSEISVKELQARLRAAADTTDEQSLIVQSCAAIEALQAERDALAARLAELEGQEPVAWVYDWQAPEGLIKGWVETNRDAIPEDATNIRPLYARPIPAEPVNARLVAAAKAALDALTCSSDPDDPGHRCGHCDDYVDRNGVVRSALRDAIAAAEAQQSDQVARPALMTIEQARDSERYAYLRSQHEGSVAASFAVFAPEQPIGEFGPVGSMPGELDAAIDAAIRANGYKVEG